MQVPVLAYGFEATFKIRDLARCFVGASLRLAKTQVVADYGGDRFAVGFDFGAVVFVNVPAEERTRILALVMKGIALAEPHAPLEEDFLIEVAEAAPPAGDVRFDRVIVPALTPAIVDTVTLLLAQSVAIDYYEEDLQEIVQVLDRKTAEMERTGRIHGSPREFAKFVGGAIRDKNQVVAALAVLDKPLGTWENEAIDRLYRGLRVVLEIEERFKALEYKLRTIQETVEVLLDLAQTRRSFILEATIVLLIVFELLLALWEKLG